MPRQQPDPEQRQDADMVHLSIVRHQRGGPGRWHAPAPAHGPFPSWSTAICLCPKSGPVGPGLRA
jgi:hypothetical protein